MTEAATDPMDPMDWFPAATVEAPADTVEAVEEQTLLERTQHRVASVRARIMRPSFRNGFGLFRGHLEEEYQAAKVENNHALALATQEAVAEFRADHDELDPEADEVFAHATMQVIENKRAIEELTVSEEYAGKKTNTFIRWVRERSNRTKALSAGGIGLLGGVFGIAFNGYVARKLGKGHVADEQDRIRETDEASNRALTAYAGELEGEFGDRLTQTASKAYEVMDLRTQQEREKAQKAVGATALGGSVGFGTSAVLIAA